MSKWIAEFDLEDGDTMPKHMDLNYMGAKIDFHCRPLWIPCSERLPEEGHDVLITKEPLEIKGYEQEVIKAKRVVDPRSGKTEWWSPEFGTLADKTVLAWMEKPEPWKGEQHGQTD